MKPKFNRFLVASITSVITLSSSAFAAEIFKNNLTDPLNSTTSWWTTEAGTTNPASILTTDTLRFGGTGQGASMTTLALGGNLTVGALRLDNVTGTPNYNATIVSGNSLTLNGNNDYSGSYLSGIVLNSSTGGSLTVNSNIVVAASQRWVSSRALTVGGNVDLGANTLSFFSAGNTTTVSGNISGTGGIARTNSAGGTLILSGANNTYSGGTNVTIGELQALASTAAGAKTTLGTGAITVASGAAVRFKNSGTTNAQSYANAINLNGATLHSEDGVVTYGGAVALTGNNTINVVWGGKNAIFSNVISGSGGINKTGTGDLFFTGANTYTGKTSVGSGGALNVATLNSVTGGVASSSLGAPVTIANGTIGLGSGGNSGTLNVIGTGETTDRVIDFAGTTGGAQVFNNGSGLLRFTSNTTATGVGAKGHTFGGSGNIQLDGNIVSNGGLTNFTKTGGGTLTLGGSISLATGDLRSNGGILQLASTASSVSGVNMALTRDNTNGLGGVLKIASGANVFSSTANTNGILGGWATFNKDTWAVSNGNASAITGLGTFTSDWATATGNADITASNTSGALTVNSLRFNTAGALTQTLSGNNVVTSGGVLVTSAVGANNITITDNQLAGGGNDLIIHQNNTLGDLNIASRLASRLTKSGAGTLNLSGNNIYTGSTVINEGVVNVTAGGLYVDAAGAAVFQGASSITVNSGATLKLNSFAYGGAGGTGGLADRRERRVLNGGTIEVTGTTHSSGNDFTVNAIGGTFRYNPLDTSNTLTLAGNGNTNIQFDGRLNFDALGNILVSDSMDGVGSLVKTGARTLSLSAANTYTGGTTVSNGVLDLTGGGGANGTIRGTVTVNTGATLRLSTGDATGFGGGATSLNTINLNGGTLNVNTASNQTLGSAVINMTGASITGIAGSNIDLFGNGSAINTLASATTSTISLSTMNLRQNDTVFNIQDGAAATDLSISAAIGDGSAGNHNMIKMGAGTMMLTGNNTYTGTTTVSAGTLFVNGALTNSAVTVNNTGTLGGANTLGTSISQLITVAAGGKLAPGNSIGTLNTGDVNLGGELVIEYGSVNIDMLAVLGTLDLTGSTVSFVQLSGALDGVNPYTFASYSTLAPAAGGTFGTVNNLPTGYKLDYAFGGNNIALVLIPEPSTALLGALSCLALLRRRRN